MTRTLLVATTLLAITACGKGQPQRGTCIWDEGALVTCTINQTHDFCDAKGQQFFPGEATAAGIEHCRTAGFTRFHYAYTPDDANFDIRTAENGSVLDTNALDQAIKGNYKVTYRRP